MPTLNPTASLTFFFVSDVMRATDHSVAPTWTLPGSSSTRPTLPVRWTQDAKR
jgi:hypothetical protein